jgi:hypothetical protein
MSGTRRSPSDDRFDRLVERLEREFRRRKGVTVTPLAERQLVVEKAMLASPGPRDAKVARNVPSDEGYEVFVASRDAGSSASHPPARPTLEVLPADRSAELGLAERAPERSWSFAGPSGEEVFVRVRAGAAASTDEVEAVLAAVREVLLEEPRP